MIFRFFQWQYLREGRPKLIRTSGGKLSDVMLSRIDIERAFQEHALQAGAAE
jgi:uncharacterized protein YjiS (DUF1127 family)